MKYDVIVIGAGAAGMMCAAQAGQRGRSVLLVDHSDKPGRKIIISGGGRCNFTNMDAGPGNYLSENPHFCKSALKRYNQYDFLDLVEKHGIAWHEKKLGQLFCDKSSRDIVAMLISECDNAGVEKAFATKATAIRSLADGGYAVESSRGTLECSSLVIASGGLSVPGTGASGFGYKIARQFNLKMIPTRAALVPFLWNQADAELFVQLAGLALDVEVKCGDGCFRENLLFTHKGLSGPAILQISSFWNASDSVAINLLPEVNLEAVFNDPANGGRRVSELLQPHLPKRFMKLISDQWITDKRPLSQLPEKTRQQLIERLSAWKMFPSDTEGYRTAEVTVGGVNTDELSSKTMECRHIPGLYFIGEVVDVTGWLGGYNFQWAWSSGWAAGQFA